MKYGYARVSTSEQDHAGQIDALTAAGAVKVFSEKISGVRADRPQLARAITALDHGDVLAVTRIDRLARSSRDLLNIVHEIEARGATFESLSEPWANTNTPTASAMLTMLSAFAQLDRAFILARTKEGRERAKANGRRFGRKPKLNEQQPRGSLQIPPGVVSQIPPPARQDMMIVSLTLFPGQGLQRPL